MSEIEERDLEERLFGKSRKRVKTKASKVSPPPSGDLIDEDTGLGWVTDDKLFSIDAPNFWTESADVEEDEIDAKQNEQPTVDLHFEELPTSNTPTSSSALWFDLADENVPTSMKGDKRLRKISRGQSRYNEEDMVSGITLQERLKEQFERLHPKPLWAKRRIGDQRSPLSDLLSSTASFLSSPSSSKTLPPHFLDIQRLENANRHNPSTGKNQAIGVTSGVVDSSWHPSRMSSVLAVSGGDHRVRLFNIDGHINAPLVTLHIPSLPLSKSTFHPSGSSLLMTGSRPYYYVFDLAAQKCLRSPRNIFGSEPGPTTPQSLAKHAFSPDGSLLAVGGRGGSVTVVEWQKGGISGAVITELRSGRGGNVGGMLWDKGGRELSVLGGRDGTEVEVWDLAARRVVRRWTDSQSYGGQIFVRSWNHEYTAIGCSTGIVNMYDSSSEESSLSIPTSETLPTVQAQPLKSLEHLTTPIDSLSFHPSNELFASASSAKKDKLKLYHLPSNTAYSNWPTSTTPLGRVTTVNFSPSGEYLGIGNTKGSVLLWGLKHFSSQ